MKAKEVARTIPGLPAVPGLVLPAIARWTVEESLSFSDTDSPFHARLTEGDDRVLLIVGENASGKSLAFRMIAQLLGNQKIEAMTLSVRERTGGGTSEMGRMRQAMIYGHEDTSSTGATSVRVVETGFRNLLDRSAPSTLCLDEPELGLSEGYSHALGQFIGEEAAKQAGNACGVMVVTHSRGLARGLVKGLGSKPTFLSVAPVETPCAEDFDAWMAASDEKTIEDLKRLGEISHERFRAMQKLMDGARS